MNATLPYGPQIPTDSTLHASLAREGRGKGLGVPGLVCCPLQAPGERDPPGCGLPLVWESLESACPLLWASGSACWKSPSLPHPLGAGDGGHAPSTWRHLSQPLFLSPLLFGRSLQDPVPRFPGLLSTYILGVFSLFLLRVFFFLLVSGFPTIFLFLPLLHRLSPIALTLCTYSSSQTTETTNVSCSGLL